MRLLLSLRALCATLATALCALALSGPAHATTQLITPGFGWTDTSGSPIEAHSTNIFKVGSTYYMIGDDMSGYSTSTGYPFQRFTCYSSTDLKNWASQGTILQASDSASFTGHVLTRAHVIYNASTSTYVLYAVYQTVGDYSQGYNAVATSSTPCGHYTFQKLYRPLGYKIGDISLFKDTDGTAYEIFSDYTNSFHGGVFSDSSTTVRIVRLTSDYLNADVEVANFPRGCREANEVVKRNGTYYLVSSLCTNWDSNDNRYRAAPSMAGPWSSERLIAEAGKTTFDSQNAGIVTVTGSATTGYLFTGDRFVQSNLNGSGWIWLPATFKANGDLEVRWADSTSVDTSTGAVVATPAGSYNNATTGTGRNQFQFSGSWTSETCWYCYQDDGRYSTTPNDYFQFRFYGSEVRLWGPKTKYLGIVAVSVDGGAEQQVNLYSATDQYGVNWYTMTGLDPDTYHTIKVRVTGQYGAVGAPSDAGYADQVTVVEDRTVDDQTTGTGTNQFEYLGTWTNDTTTCPGCYGSNDHYSAETGASYKVRFNGTGVRVLHSVGPADGNADYSIDGGTPTVVDGYAPQHEDNVVMYEVSGLTAGPHTLEVKVDGTKNAASSGYNVGADRVIVQK